MSSSDSDLPDGPDPLDDPDPHDGPAVSSGVESDLGDDESQPADVGSGPDDVDAVDDDLVAARRVMVLVGAALVAVALCVVLVVSGLRGDVGSNVVDGDGAASASRSIGPDSGEDVDAYVAQRDAALVDAVAEASGRRVAVVSLTGYVTPDDVADLLGEGTDDVFMGPLLIAPIASEPALTTDLDATLAEIRADAEAQLAEIEAIAPTVVDDPDFSAFYAEEIARYRVLLDSIDEDEVVYGFVVSAPTEVLERLAADDGVRMVDVGTGGALAPGTTLRGLRPEEITVVGEPPVRP